MEKFKTKLFVLKDEMPREITPHDFMHLEKNQQLRIQADWYDIQKQHGEGKLPFVGPLRLFVTFYFKSLKTMLSKDIDFLVRHILTISEGIIYNDSKFVTTIVVKKRISSLNGTQFCFEEDAPE